MWNAPLVLCVGSVVVLVGAVVTDRRYPRVAACLTILGFGLMLAIMVVIGAGG